MVPDTFSSVAPGSAFGRIASSGPLPILALILIGFVLTGCRASSVVTSESTSPSSSDTADPSSTEQTGPTATDLEAIYRARKDSARLQFTQADVDFMRGMIAHHAQALVMSRLAPTHGAGSEIQTLAARIVNAQKDEIATMKRWLRDRGESPPEVHIEGISLMVHGTGDHHDMHMPGMLTEEQLRELDAARGAEFDRLFLTYMIQHHSGAVEMVDALFGTDGAAQGHETFKLASDIQVDQRTEIARMELMLEERSNEAAGQ